jgi:endonuclease/exonuclease/phosphatase (EEP) superfamily protein YafD
MMTIFWILWSFIALSAAAATIMGYFGHIGWGFDLASHFRIQYFILLSLSAVIYALGGYYVSVGLAIFFAWLNFRLLLPFYIKQTNCDLDKRMYRIMLSNVLQKNREYQRVKDFICSANPDFVVLIEVNQPWLEQMEAIRPQYPYLQSAPRTDDYGIAIFSRVPVASCKIQFYGDTDRPTITAQFELEEQILTIVAPHPSPPKNPRGAKLRNRQLSEIAEFIADQNNPCLLVGDLNITPWSPHFKDLLQNSGLKESRIGFGVQPTWPTTNPFLYVPIDHILISKEICVQSQKLGPRVGSDHLPVLVDFSIQTEN